MITITTIVIIIAATTTTSTIATILTTTITITTIISFITTTTTTTTSYTLLRRSAAADCCIIFTRSLCMRLLSGRDNTHIYHVGAYLIRYLDTYDSYTDAHSHTCDKCIKVPVAEIGVVPCRGALVPSSRTNAHWGIGTLRCGVAARQNGSASPGANSGSRCGCSYSARKDGIDNLSTTVSTTTCTSQAF